MIRFRLQHFYNKQKLALKLARFDLLFLVNDLSYFKLVIKPASLFVKPSPLSIPQRIQNFLNSSPGYLPDLLVSEFSSIAFSQKKLFFYLPSLPSSFEAGSVLVKENIELRDSSFYLSLFKGMLITDFPQFLPAFSFFTKRLDLVSDRRLYAAELDNLLTQSTDSQKFLPLQINWIKTSSEELYLDLSSNIELTTILDEQSQRNFAELFFNHLFEKSIFISYWENVAVDSSGRVAMIDFDYIYSASEELKQFALDINRNPQSFEEQKLAYALKLLESYCPLVNLNELLVSYQAGAVKATPFLSHQSGFLNQLSKQGVYFGLENAPNLEQPQSSLIQRLLSTQNKKPESNMLFFWGPALITALILFILWRF